MESFFWYDLETSGRDPRWQRILQFAGQRTTIELEPLGDPLVRLVRLDDDVLPEPDACVLTGLTPQRCADGLPEPELLARARAELMRPGTCVAGYNNLRFDDEFLRFALYRNLFDPYEREWRGGNSRWDLIDLVRMAGALRPEGLRWPVDPEGRPSYRLEALTEANGIEHGAAHDALADVRATVELARLLRAQQPRLFAWYLSLRDRRRAGRLLEPTLGAPVLHVSGRYPARHHCLAVVSAVAAHPWNANAVIVVDLSADPEPLETLDAEALRERLFAPADPRRSQPAPLGLKTVRLNRCPALAPTTVLREADVARLGLDLDRCEANLARLRAAPDLAERCRAAFADRPPAAEDVDASLYDGFLDDGERAALADLRDAPPEALREQAATEALGERARALLRRFRARHRRASLSASELAAWRRTVAERLVHGTAGMPSLADYRARLRELETAGAEPALLAELDAWGSRLERDYLDGRTAAVEPNGAA